MSQFYSDPSRENESGALPDCETFAIDGRADSIGDCPLCDWDTSGEHAAHRGWYWQSCFPGCLPDGAPVGPFATEDEAIADCRSLSEA